MDSESSVAVAITYYNTICFQKGEKQGRAGGEELFGVQGSFC